MSCNEYTKQVRAEEVARRVVIERFTRQVLGSNGKITKEAR